MARIKDWQMMQRCWDNGFRFYPVPSGEGKVRLEFQMQKDYQIGKVEYSQDKKGQLAYSERMRELYVEAYFNHKHRFIKDKVWCFKKNDYIVK
jgi:hypothetical protein|tara:strand:- start:5051 stop:5329 length:279 start_codon:yes stop_codon:yes gene_type:complete